MQLSARPATMGLRAPMTSRRMAVAKRDRIAMKAMPVADVASLADAVVKSLGPTAASFAALDLPAPLVKFGHPANMATVLLAMGGYGSYLGWQIRTSDDTDVIAKAKDLHPKLLGGAFFFFALGASGGLMSLIMQGKPVLESPHATTGFLGLGLLSIQAMLPLFFGESPGLRDAHTYFGSAIMALLLVHMALGINFALSL